MNFSNTDLTLLRSLRPFAPTPLTGGSFVGRNGKTHQEALVSRTPQTESLVGAIFNLLGKHYKSCLNLIITIMKFNTIALPLLLSSAHSAPTPAPAPLLDGLLGGGNNGQYAGPQGQPQQGGLVSSLPIAGPIVGNVFNGIVYPILDSVPIAGPLVRSILGGLI
ncbi:hypothetical protein CONCODRAFT_10283 [Conidiobolus coronatus NRRL 28638]|uniref:Uncharacterized protein n=1 Tax=Conidiobolus coronatus (strain ATCC 28846 / CBS 209.66 / NRRL 28638) TaxID=796925 RepID=A0A137NXW0_CONC2|nr:hypothetical protein CONCODRAFT_10283 [Conidiobolus coronatus NRRL 28638]|eukprot:KXN67625.1 hypothetical protein CONCODRAFT_10283 [Conidiobolus coronatus NRRL 28638]